MRLGLGPEGFWRASPREIHLLWATHLESVRPKDKDKGRGSQEPQRLSFIPR